MIGEKRLEVGIEAETRGAPFTPTAASAPRLRHVLSSTDVEARPWRRFAGQNGVRDKVLWEDSASGSYAGMMELAPGAQVNPHVHRQAIHHLYVVSGSCELSVSERVIGPGAYAFVPAETLHGIERAGPEGCTLFFLYLRAEIPRTEGL